MSTLHKLSHLRFTATLWSRFDYLSFRKGELGLENLQSLSEITNSIGKRTSFQTQPGSVAQRLDAGAIPYHVRTATLAMQP